MGMVAVGASECAGRSAEGGVPKGRALPAESGFLVITLHGQIIIILPNVVASVTMGEKRLFDDDSGSDKKPKFSKK